MLDFDNWEVSLPFITPETVVYPIEATPDFFVTPEYLRGKPTLYDTDFEQPDKSMHWSFVRSHLAFAKYEWRKQLTNLDSLHGAYVGLQMTVDI